jgi:hypothetical protein
LVGSGEVIYPKSLESVVDLLHDERMLDENLMYHEFPHRKRGFSGMAAFANSNSKLLVCNIRLRVEHRVL